ncbi:MAG: formylglycine-generating enzyme family protein [Parvularculaceae bacterium]
MTKRAAFVFSILGALALAGCSSDTTAFRDCESCPQMTVIPAGMFNMGAEGGEEGRPEGPVRSVSVPAFALGVYEVTYAEFSRFSAETGYEPAGDCRVWPNERMATEANFDWRDPGYPHASEGREPVACLNWTDATAYVSWLSEKTGNAYRLPTEAEWEYAARAGSTTDFYWGDDPEAGCEYANMNDASGAQNNFPWANGDCDDGYPQASPVGAFKPNAFGLYDIIGNVWEWTKDCYVLYYEGAPVDGSAHEVSGECERRSVRGGSWITRPDRNRVSFRGRDPEDTVYFMFGLRVARDLEAAR